MENTQRNLKAKVLNNKEITVMFTIVTLFFIIQHAAGFSWDFSAYSLNAQYLLTGNGYFEWYRAPLTPFLIMIFSFGGWVAAEYLYIIFTSLLFLFSVVRLAESLEWDKKKLYALMLNPYLMAWGIAVGTELLSFSLLVLFTAYIFNNKAVKSSFSYGLSLLARYSNIIYLPIILASKNLKSIIIFIVILAALASPWLLYNYEVGGNAMTSIGNSYALNVKYRQYIHDAPKIEHILLVGNYLIIFALLGIKKIKLDKKTMVFIAILLLTIYSYATTPVKVGRYLFPILLPLVYFSYEFGKRFDARKIFAFNVAMLIALGFAASSLPMAFFIPSNLEYLPVYRSNCTVSSNQWVLLNYFGQNAIPKPWSNDTEYFIKQGYPIVMYHQTLENAYNVLEEARYYTVYGPENCTTNTSRLDESYIEERSGIIKRLKNYSIENDPCRTIIDTGFCDIFKKQL